MKIQKLLIANRGEIALRIMATARKLGIQCAAVYSIADKDSPHVEQADFALPLNSDVPSESYLNISKIIELAKQNHCEAIHPGYGFLAENAEFANACKKAGIIFIGPEADAITLMGDKAQAKAFCKKNKIPVIPGEEHLEQTLDSFKKVADEIGYPLLVKASAGGGGKGMKLVEHSDELETAYQSAKREALKSFSDDTLLIEKYFPTARHVEVQVLSDQHGNHFHLFDRDCSIQRRHQKVIEEAPAPNLKQETRNAMYECATKLCSLINYQGVGTLEFLVDEAENIYLMEMNTRLQVEHAVTEQITGIDLVEQQIRVAQGEQLLFQQNDIQANGHAIEARIYAEQCDQDFLPASGLLKQIRFPDACAGVRIDHSLKNDTEITALYDPMIAKVSCWSSNRENAVRKLDNSLQSTLLLGIVSNRWFLRNILNHEAFLNAKLSTRFIDLNKSQLCSKPQPDSSGLALLNSLFLACNQAHTLLTARELKQENSPWFSADNWRTSKEHDHNYTLHIRDSVFPAQCERSIELETFSVISSEANKVLAEFKYEGKTGLIEYILNKNKNEVACLSLVNQELEVEFSISNAETGKQVSQQSTNLNYLAPLNGKVVSVLVNTGDSVEDKQVLAVLEAMKMEHIIKAQSSGIVETVNISEGDQVSAEQLLIKLSEES